MKALPEVDDVAQPIGGPHDGQVPVVDVDAPMGRAGQHRLQRCRHPLQQAETLVVAADQEGGVEGGHPYLLLGQLLEAALDAAGLKQQFKNAGAPGQRCLQDDGVVDIGGLDGAGGVEHPQLHLRRVGDVAVGRGPVDDVARVDEGGQADEGNRCHDLFVARRNSASPWP